MTEDIVSILKSLTIIALSAMLYIQTRTVNQLRDKYHDR
jgi:hypothetical protein